MYKYVKRGLDILLSLVGCIIMLPFILMIIIAIKIDSRGPVTFKQKRMGKSDAHFYILKFRTMRIETPKDVPTHLLNDPDKYITRVGSFLRKTSLDELPQIWNILKGDMSIIGPRPALWNQNDLIKERKKYSIDLIRPGLTGWAQINGRDELDLQSKIKYDKEYAENYKLIFDIKIFFLTFVRVIRSEGIKEGKSTGENIKWSKY